MAIRQVRRTLVAALVCVFGGVGVAQSDPAMDKWIDKRLSAAEKELLGRSVGHAPPAFGEGISWLSGGPVAWADLRGRVVVLQSFGPGESGRTVLRRLGTILKDVPERDVAAVALHTPEGAAKVPPNFKEAGFAFPIALDSVGRFCDDMGIWKEPATILIDRQGRVRSAGVSAALLPKAMKVLLDEPYDDKAEPPGIVPPRDGPGGATPSQAKSKPPFPVVRPSGSPNNMLGRKGPALQVQTWLTAQPEVGGKVLLVDFWATWCGPCRKSIPHMNDLAAMFKESVAIVGLSDEDAPVVREFMKKTKMAYAVATDPGGRMARVTKHQGIPFVIVVSPDGIVRWQGHPMALDEATLRQIVEASGGSKGGDAAGDQMRWIRK